jgi:hypothetical protein
VSGVVRRLTEGKHVLNRGVLIVRPKQPFLDWAATFDESCVLPSPDDEQTVYLIPSFEDDGEANTILRQVFREVFEREFYGWHTDPAAWPRRRTFTTFKNWFSIELHSVVEDLGGTLIFDENGSPDQVFGL